MKRKVIKMAVRTNFELINFLASGSNDLYINATDKDGVQRVVSSANNTKRYFLHKYGTRMYPVLTGMNPASVSDALTNFVEDFRAWVSNRQRNIDLQYQALYDYDYSPIDNYDRHETETIEGSDTTTYGKRDTESGSDSLQHGHAVRTIDTSEEHQTGSDTNTKSGQIATETQKAGFNAPNSYTNDTKTTEGYNDYEDETSYGKNITGSGDKTETNSGTDTTTYGKINTQSGSDTLSKENERDLHAWGNIGVTTSTAMIDELIKSRMMSLADMLLDNFINDYTYYA